MLGRFFERSSSSWKNAEKIGCLYLQSDCVFTYRLFDSSGKCVGIINAHDYDNKDFIQIDAFCVALKYRNDPNIHYGRQLLQRIIDEAKLNLKLKRIIVIPKGEERFDNIEPIETEELYRIYEKLGFRFADSKRLPYGNVMIMEL